MSEVIFNAIEQLHSNENKLVLVVNPTQMQGASSDIDQELHKLMWNIQVLSELRKIAGDEAVRLEQEYHKSTLEYANGLTTEELSKLGIVRSDKFKYIKMILNNAYSRVEYMKNKSKYFTDMLETYKEWINVYKKTREIPEK